MNAPTIFHRNNLTIKKKTCTPNFVGVIKIMWIVFVERLT
jgi:hypothetical protein